MSHPCRRTFRPATLLKANSSTDVKTVYLQTLLIEKVIKEHFLVFLQRQFDVILQTGTLPVPIFSFLPTHFWSTLLFHIP